MLALLILHPSLSQAYDILVLKSSSDPAYKDVLTGFRSVRSNSLRVIVLSDYAEVDVIRVVREDRPKTILVIGDAALKAARKVTQTPVVAVMSLGIHTLKASHPNLTGIGLFVPPERYVSMFQTMKASRIGVIYDPARSGWYLDLARQAAEAAGIELVAREITAPREAVKRLSALAGKVDALWMLPDSTAVTRETTEAYFRFGQQQAVPVVSFAANYLGLGAAAVLEIDRVAMGRQANDIVTALLQDDGRDRIPLSFPSGITVRTNPGVLRRLGYSNIESDLRSR